MISITNLYKIPLYYISFQKNKKVEEQYRSYGFSDINHFSAVPGKKLDIKKLREEDLISIRSYDDLLSGRFEHSGMPSLGAIGCTLSHYELWCLCEDTNLPYIIIAEEDNKMGRKLGEKDIQNIISVLDKPNSIFISTNISKRDHRKHFFGTNFYIASKGACKKLAEKCFPIDVQTDWYMAHLATIGDVIIEGYPISRQNKTGSSIQKMCITCWLPKNNWFYIGVCSFILIILISVVYYRYVWKACEESCGSDQ